MPAESATDVEVQLTDRLITMSTCACSFENARFIVIGRLLPLWQLPEGAVFPPEPTVIPAP